ncbi:MAG: ATP-binding cassette domain-containing protein, partial [Nitrosopumilaceae archaeon]
MSNLSKTYGSGENKVKALDNANFSIEKGQFVLVVGSSGSGKSTLLNMIGLLDRPTKGKIFIDGIDTTKLSENQISAFRNKKLGFIFQFSNLLTDLTVLENVLLPRQIAGTNGSAEKDAKELLKTV